MNDSELHHVPTHLGFILDGNRRWAKLHSLPEYDGHLAGYNALREVVKGCAEAGVKFVSIYAFSHENWKRDKKEVAGLMRLALHAIASDTKSLIKNGVRTRFLGRREGISGKLLAAIEKVEAATRSQTRCTLAVCFSYGGQQELVDAMRQCAKDGLPPEAIDEQAVASRLYAPDIPPIDMIVRTSGEQRLSNFMLWRSAYSEFLFLQKYWPDMTKEDVAGIIEEYGRRTRRFGG